MRSLATLLLALATAACAAAPPRGPAGPEPLNGGTAAVAPRVEAPAEFHAAIEQGTRTATGRPGSGYWQNSASYTITAQLEPGSRRLDGTVEIGYRNQSPDTLPDLHVDLLQNFHAPGAERFENAETTGGVAVRRVAVNGQALAPSGSGPGYAIRGTRLAIRPPAPVLPGQGVSITIEYGFRLPRAGAGARMGYDGDDLLYLAYWYPQMAVYDDVIGWHPDLFVGTTEFYAGFADYRYSIAVPAGWVLVGTGTLENAEQVLRPAVLERLRRADASAETVAVLSPRDFPGNATVARSGRVTWQFRADSVRDVAFSVTRNMHWDARRAAVGDRDGDGATDHTRINAIYRPSARRWRAAASHAAHAITALSEFTAMPYPWPHMTAVEGEGIIGGGMEYPMMTLIGSYTNQSDEALYAVIAHELAHMWVPMQVSTDERRYSWLDEGTTNFNENHAVADRYPGSDPRAGEQEQYLQIAGTGREGEIMRRSAYHDSQAAYFIASYSKPAAVLHALRGVLGDSIFLRSYRGFLADWRYKHAYPWDLWHAFETASGRDLDWFWQPWYFTTWTLDQAIARVEAGAVETRITVANRGRIAMPAHLTITLAGGETVKRTVPVEHWLSGEETATVAVPGSAAVTRVEIDAERHFPDADRRNNVWAR